MSINELKAELTRIRARRKIAEARVDEYEQRAIRSCRRGQAMHVERRVKEMELDTVAPLRQRELKLEAELAALAVEP